jgi:hypothetical protein
MVTPVGSYTRWLSTASLYITGETVFPYRCAVVNRSSYLATWSAPNHSLRRMGRARSAWASRGPGLQQPVLRGDRDRLGACVHDQPVEDLLQVIIDGGGRDDEALADRFVARALSHQPQHLPLPLGQRVLGGLFSKRTAEGASESERASGSGARIGSGCAGSRTHAASSRTASAWVTISSRSRRCPRDRPTPIPPPREARAAPLSRPPRRAPT